jgi:nucleoside-diphosphate-sugar epimerase
MEHDGAAERGTSELHVVVGSGPIGSGIARELARQGHQVRIVTRSGSAPACPPGQRSARTGGGVEAVAADAADAQTLARLTDGAVALYNCANPPYHRWPELWPPIARSLLAAAEKSGAVLVTISNLYGYGPASESIGQDGYDAGHPMTEQTPLAATGKKGKVRAQMWRDTLAAHQAGRVRATEIRASDYVGPGANAVLGERVVPRVQHGKAVTVIGRADRLRTWSFTDDVARMAVIAGSDSRAWGRAWHAPSGQPRTQRQAVEDLARVAGVRPVPVRTLARPVLYGLGMVSPLMRELRETEYQFSEDFVMDSSAAQATFGLEPAGWDYVIAAVLDSFPGPARG